MWGNVGLVGHWVRAFPLLGWPGLDTRPVPRGAVGAALWPFAAWVEWWPPVDGPVCPLVGFVLVLRRVQAEAGGLGWSWLAGPPEGAA